MAHSRPWHEAVSGKVRVTVRLTPRAQRDAVDGPSCLSDGRVVLAARVRAVPEDGRANAALIRLLADALGLPKSRITLVEGATSRIKVLEMVGDAAALAGGLDRLVRP